MKVYGLKKFAGIFLFEYNPIATLPPHIQFIDYSIYRFSNTRNCDYERMAIKNHHYRGEWW